MQERIGRYISMIHRQEQRFVCKKMESYGLDLGFPEYLFLYGVSLYEGCMQKDLCWLQGVDDAMATRSVRKLMERGYLFRNRQEEDRRAYRLYLTESGREIIPKLEEVLNQWHQEITGEMDEGQRIQLTSQLKRVAQLAQKVNGMENTGWPELFGENRREREKE